MKNRKEGFLKGVVYLMVSQVTIKVLGMIYSLYLTNKKGFGDSGNAICMSAYQVYALFLGICSIGIPNAISRIIAENISLGNEKACKKILKVSLLIFTMISFAFCLTLYIGSDFIAEKILSIKESSDILKILAPSVVFCTIEAVFRGYFIGREKIKISAKIQSCEQFLKTIITIIFVEIIARKSNFDTNLMARGSMIAASLATAFSFIYSIKEYLKVEKISPLEKNDKSTVKGIKEILEEIFVVAIPISITSVLIIMESNIDSISIVRLLKNKIGEKSAREKYGIITSKVNLLVSLPMSLNGAIAVALVPEISRIKILFKKGILKERIEFSLLMTLTMTVPIMVGYILFAHNIIDLLYPNANAGAELLRLGAITIVFTSITQTMSGILQGMGDSKIHMKAISVAMIFKLLLNFALIPINALLEKGAILSTIICDCIIFGILFVRLNKYAEIGKSLLYNFSKILIIMFISILIIDSIFHFALIASKIKFVLKIISLTIVYFVLIFKLKILSFNTVIKQLGINGKEKK